MNFEAAYRLPLATLLGVRYHILQIKPTAIHNQIKQLLSCIGDEKIQKDL